VGLVHLGHRAADTLLLVERQRQRVEPGDHALANGIFGAEANVPAPHSHPSLDRGADQLERD
jgi:hypothetical protein